jgi:hypothetical protein
VKGLSLRNAARIWGTFVRHGVSLVRTLRSTCKGIMTARGVCQRFIILFAILGRNNVVDEEDPRSRGSNHVCQEARTFGRRKSSYDFYSRTIKPGKVDR